jgi:hypothetical protein
VVEGDVDEKGVDLDEFAKFAVASFGETLGVALAVGKAEAPRTRPSVQDRRGNHRAAIHQAAQDGQRSESNDPVRVRRQGDCEQGIV